VTLLRLSAFFAVAVLHTGCENGSGGSSDRFTRLRASNYRDEVIAEWTARGKVVSLARGGYRITAVERISAPPMRNYTRYPDGWVTTVQGAHIWKWECGKPLWLAEMESDSTVTRTTSKKVTVKIDQTRAVTEDRFPSDNDSDDR
jgi:hypothetical protein